LFSRCASGESPHGGRARRGTCPRKLPRRPWGRRLRPSADRTAIPRNRPTQPPMQGRIPGCGLRAAPANAHRRLAPATRNTVRPGEREAAASRRRTQKCPCAVRGLAAEEPRKEHDSRNRPSSPSSCRFHSPSGFDPTIAHVTRSNEESPVSASRGSFRGSHRKVTPHSLTGTVSSTP